MFIMKKVEGEVKRQLGTPPALLTSSAFGLGCIPKARESSHEELMAIPAGL
jgi:hypothetical protein